MAQSALIPLAQNGGAYRVRAVDGVVNAMRLQLNDGKQDPPVFAVRSVFL